jgi:geranylgeranyl diphosphate synthase type I
VPGQPPLVDHDTVRSQVDALLVEHVAALREELTAVSSDSGALVDALASMLGGGKRLRAGFTYWSWRAHGGAPGGDQEVAVLRVGAALELFQAAALFHDDVMDDSDTRRGRPTAHRTFAGRHARGAMAGDARRFGEGAAILLGDLALVACGRELGAALSPMDRDVAERATELVGRMEAEVTAGQYLDLLAQARPWSDDAARMERTAWEVLRAKSARYSVERPLTLGAVLAGADDEAVAACSRIGMPVGEAFQLRDDLLGVFGDPAATGKPAGDDLREGKRTVLVARALAAADPSTRHLLTTHLGDPTLDVRGTERVAAAISATGAPDQLESLIAERLDLALELIAASAWDEPAASVLVDLVRRAVDRRA